MTLLFTVATLYPTLRRAPGPQSPRRCRSAQPRCEVASPVHTHEIKVVAYTSPYMFMAPSLPPGGRLAAVRRRRSLCYRRTSGHVSRLWLTYLPTVGRGNLRDKAFSGGLKKDRIAALPTPTAPISINRLRLCLCARAPRPPRLTDRPPRWSCRRRSRGSAES